MVRKNVILIEDQKHHKLDLMNWSKYITIKMNSHIQYYEIICHLIRKPFYYKRSDLVLTPHEFSLNMVQIQASNASGLGTNLEF